MTVGAGPFGEKFCELGDAMVGALVPNPCNSSGAESNHHIQVVPEERRGEERGGEGLPCRTMKGRAEVRAAAARRGRRRTAAAALCIAIIPRAPSAGSVRFHQS